MKTRNFFIYSLLLALSGTALCDTFKHKETGQTFDGFMTQKIVGGQTRVYSSNEKKFIPIDLNEYEITFNEKGRRENVILVPITQPEIMISRNLAQTIADTIVDASNAGPLAVIVQIDSPGGPGEYMKIVASAITKTTNCPVVAYISGGPWGGAFSSAAVVALACDKVYISSTASIGAVGPVPGTSKSAEDYESYLTAYAPDTLVTYGTFVAALAQENNRPQVLARGLIDKKMAIVEVTDETGKRDYVLRDDRQPNQTIVRTMSEGVTVTPAASTDEKAATTSAADVVGSVLNLTAEDAVKSGIADKIVSSRKDLLAAIELPEAKVVPANGIDAAVKKFTAAKRTIDSGLAQIDRLENEAEILDTNLQQVREQLRTGTQTRELYQGSTSRRKDGYDDSYGTYDNRDQQGTYNPAGRNGGTRYRSLPRERITTPEPIVSPEAISGQLSVILRQLTSEYRRVINLAERWPGALPADVSLSTLEKNLSSANAQLDNLNRISPVYPTQQTPMRSIGSRGY